MQVTFGHVKNLAQSQGRGVVAKVVKALRSDGHTVKKVKPAPPLYRRYRDNGPGSGPRKPKPGK